MKDFKSSKNKVLKDKKNKLLIRKCHACGHINESKEELQSCVSCRKGFLPSNYFNKIHVHGPKSYAELFSEVEALSEEDLIKGLTVIW